MEAFSFMWVSAFRFVGGGLPRNDALKIEMRLNGKVGFVRGASSISRGQLLEWFFVGDINSNLHIHLLPPSVTVVHNIPNILFSTLFTSARRWRGSCMRSLLVRHGDPVLLGKRFG